jgi:hypothetical protein
VDDDAVSGGDQVDDLADGGCFLVAGDDEDAGPDLGGVARLVEKGPDVAVWSSSLRSAVMSTRYISTILMVRSLL